jgi:hypothetical protein
LGGVAGCTENNEQSITDSTAGKSQADPKAAQSYDQLRPKDGMIAPPQGAHVTPAPGSATAAPKEAPAPEKKD